MEAAEDPVPVAEPAAAGDPNPCSAPDARSDEGHRRCLDHVLALARALTPNWSADAAR